MSRLSTRLRSLALKLGATSLVAGLLAGCDGASFTQGSSSSITFTQDTPSDGITIPAAQLPMNPTVIKAIGSSGSVYHIGTGGLEMASYWDQLTISFTFTPLAESFDFSVSVVPFCGTDICNDQEGYAFDTYLYEGTIHVDLRLASHFTNPEGITGLRILSPEAGQLDFEISNLVWRDDLDSSCASTSGGNIFVGDISSGGIELYSSSSSTPMTICVNGDIAEEYQHLNNCPDTSSSSSSSSSGINVINDSIDIYDAPTYFEYEPTSHLCAYY